MNKSADHVTDKLASYFNLNDNVIHVNHAAVGPWPKRTVHAVEAFAEENGRRGSQHYGHWLSIEAELRQQLAQLINAPSGDDIALLKNTSEGLSLIAYGLQWQAGDNIVIADEEFPSNRIVWESLQNQGVEIRLVSLSAGDTPEQALIEQFDERSRLLSISAVQYASGIKLDLKTLGKACRQNNTLFCVDAIQQIGALQFDAQDIQADFVVADGHKWMLGPEGLALFYCRPEHYEKLNLLQYGWHMVEDLSDFNTMDYRHPAQSGRRFECGSPNMLTIHALHASVSVLLEVGMAQIEDKVLEKVQYLIDGFSTIKGVHIISPTEAHRHAGIFTFSKPASSNPANSKPASGDGALYEYLVSKGVICALRGGIRFSPHFHTPEAQLDKLVDWVAKY